MDINHGGRAFPVSVHVDDFHWANGMSLRQYYAAQVINGMLSGSPTGIRADIAARIAFQFADEMIKQGGDAS